MDKLTKEERTLNMSKIRSKDSLLEINFRKALWEKGVRYRKNVLTYEGKPDLVLKKYKTVVFIDSCFWHFCPVHGHLPKSNIKFWRNKLQKNYERDQRVNAYYKKQKWRIIRIWEHDMEKDLNRVVKKTIGLIKR